MTQENFIAEYKALQAQKQEIDGRMVALKEEYTKSLPFKVGDCVRIDVSRRHIEKAWIVEIAVETWSLNCVDLVINKPKKDGTRSNRRTLELFVDISKIEVLESATPEQ